MNDLTGPRNRERRDFDPYTQEEAQQRIEVAFALRHMGHDGIPGAPDDSCPRCNAERELVAVLQELEEAKREAAENMEALLDERDRSMKWVKSHGALATELADAKAQVKELQKALSDLLVHIPNGTATDPYKVKAYRVLAGSVEERRDRPT